MRSREDRAADTEGSGKPRVGVRWGLSRALTALVAAIGALLLSAGPALAGRIEPTQTSSTGSLAFTGINVLLVAGVGLALIATGMIVRRFAPLHGGARRHR